MKKCQLFVIFAVFVLFFSCKNIFNSNIKPSKLQNDGYVEVTCTAKSDSINAQTNLNSRSALPTFSSLEYKYTATATDETDISNTANNATFKIKLPIGKVWTVTVNVVTTENPTDILFTGTKTIDTSNTIDSVLIPLNRNTESTANGSIKLALNVDGGIATSINYKYSLVKKDGTSVSTSETATSLGATTNYIEIQNIQPGEYDLAISFYDTNNYLIYDLRTTASVFANLETNKWVSENGADVNGTVFKLTQELLDEFKSTTFYVKGEDSANLPTPINGVVSASDQNVGGAYTPLATLNAAFAKCSNDNKEYTVYVDGTVLINNTVTAASNKTITVRAFNSTARATIKANTSLTDSCFNIAENGKLGFENVVLSGEGATFNAEGGCINSAGILTLANCEVKDFSSSGSSGGAIYSNKGTIQATNCIFANNTVTHNEFGNGGAVYIRAEGASSPITHNFVNCEFTNNQAITTGTSAADCGAGGAIHVGEKNTVIISGENTLFQNNSATKFGGAICVVDNDPVLSITGATISECSSDEFGGAIYQRDESTISLTNVIIEDCTTTKLGGGIHITGIVSLQDSTINKCKTTDTTTSGFGGGIYIKSGELRTDELTISECSARSGGGLYSTGENVILRGGRITNCSATSCGGGIYSNRSFSIEEMNITNCSITNDASSNGGAGIYISKSSNSNFTADINNIQISNCSIPTYYAKGNAIFIKEEYSSGFFNVNIIDSIIGIDKSENFTKGTKPTTADVPYDLSVSDGANNGGKNVINIEGNSESNNTVVVFINTKVSYNNSKEQTVYLNYANATFDENSELLANYVNDSWGEIYIYQNGIVNFGGKIHHNFSNYANITNNVASAIRLNGSDTVLYIGNKSEIYDNDLGHTPNDTYYVSAIYNHQGTINFEGGTLQNNYNNSIHCYEIYNNGTLNISGNAKVGDPTETSKYNSIYLAEHAGTQSTITINDDITSDFVGRIYLPDFQYVLDTQVLDGSKVSDNNHKFEMVNINYSIKTDGKLEEKTSTSSASTMYTAISDADIHDVTLNLVTNQTIDIPDSIPLNGGVMPEYALTIPPGKTLTIKGTSDTPATLTIPNSGDALIVEGDLILENVIITANVHWSAITIKDNGRLFLNDGVVIKDINFGGSSFGAICLSGNNSYLEMNEGALIQNARSNSTGAVELANSTAIFVMNGGTIENCILGSSHNSLGGGVCINNGTFTMTGGTIHNNSTSTTNANSYGGGVYIEAGTFTMTGGNITGNTTYLDHGDDLYVKSGASFTMTGGTIGTAVISNGATYSKTAGTITNESRE